MKKSLSLSFLAGIIVVTMFSGCAKKSDSTDSTPTSNTPSTQTPSFSDGWGLMAAVTSVSYQVVAGVTIPLFVNTATAAFQASAGSSTYVDAGTVSLNSKTLTKSTNNVYIYNNLTDPLDFSAVNWNVTGAGSIPAITYSDNKPIPDYSGFSTLPGTISRASDLTIALSGTISDADTVYIIISGTDGKFVMKRLAGNAAECKFTTADLSVLSAGTGGIIQVTPWNYKTEDFSDKKFYFVNEKAYTKSGITIN
jgi:hypothetical protein